MNYIKRLALVVTLLLSMPLAAFEFDNSSAPYDFSQTINIFIVDQKNSKFFAMFDPFEMKMTTIPSRFYVAVMGVLQRGHSNAEGVSLIEGRAVDYEFVLIFRSLNRSHVMFIGQNWIIDGNKKILLSPEETIAIYELLLQRSTSDQKRNLDELNPLFKEINERQNASDAYPQLNTDGELKSIVESKNTIAERLPESHNDTQTLPYYNKALENQKFLEEYEKAKKLKEQKTQTNEKPKSTPQTIEPIKEKNESVVLNSPSLQDMAIDVQEQTSKIHWFFLGLLAVMAFLAFIKFKRN